jgi:hypothetical protein
MGRLDGDHRKPAAPSRRTQRSGLEVIDKRRGSDSHLAPPLFVSWRGWHAAKCWDEHLLNFFADKGYRALAVNLRGPRRPRVGETRSLTMLFLDKMFLSLLRPDTSGCRFWFWARSACWRSARIPNVRYSSSPSWAPGLGRKRAGWVATGFAGGDRPLELRGVSTATTAP